MTGHDTSPQRPAWHWYALAGVLLVALLMLDLVGVLDTLGPPGP